MLSMTQRNDIRKLYFEQGNNISQVAKATGNDRKTIRKYLEVDDWSPKPEAVKPKKKSKLDPFKSTIDEWLEEDKKFNRKQRHTAKRVYMRLCELYPESFNCSYRTVATYVSDKKKDIFSKNEAALPLQVLPGEAQVDFGSAEFFENGEHIHGKYLNLSFQNSNSGYTQLFYGENLECLEQGMMNIFSHIGGVPHTIRFDNASSMVSSVLKHGERTLTDNFLRFKNHFGFKAVFCNPARGNEKGNVENKVGYLRRNLLVPVPRFLDIHEFNKKLLLDCDEDHEREHYKKGTYISKLMEEDREALIPLPGTSFEAVRYEFVKVDAYGKFKLNKGKHEYSTAPKYAKSSVQIRLSAFSVSVLDDSLRTVIEHRRLYGENRQESMKWIPYLDQLAIRPAALKYTGIYQMLPHPLKNYLEECDRSEKGNILKALSEMTKKSDFESAVAAFSEAFEIGALDKDSIQAIHNRLVMPEISLPPCSSDKIPILPVMEINLSVYDNILRSKGGEYCD